MYTAILLYMMEFSVKLLNKLESDLNKTLRNVLKTAKTETVAELNHSNFSKLNKETLTNFVFSLSKLAEESVNLCKSASETIDDLKSECISNKNEIIDIQAKNIEDIKKTVKSEVTTWSEVVKKNCPTGSSASSFCLKKVQQVVKSAVDSSIRSNNVIVYGAEDDDETENLFQFGSYLMTELGVLNPRPEILAASRIGSSKAGSEDKRRPIKLTFANSEVVRRVMKLSHRLKDADEADGDKYWSNMYLAPDRDKEERATHHKLVVELKQRITEDPTRYHFIRAGKVNSADKELSITDSAH